MTNITTPVGRFVSGSLVKPRTTNAEGQPLVIKNGANAGQPFVKYDFGIAIPKTPGLDWTQEPWGAAIIEVGKREAPHLFDAQTGKPYPGRFATKVADGDDAVPNKNGNKNCDREGYPGHWVMFWSNGQAPKTFNADGSAPVNIEDIKPGHYIQIAGDIAYNKSTQNPGVYLNHKMVAHTAAWTEIQLSEAVDPKAAGFGQAPLPAGITSTPPAGMSAPVTPPTPPAQTPPPPAVDLVQQPPAPPVEEKYDFNGTVYTRSQLLGMPGWTEAHLAGLKRV